MQYAMRPRKLAKGSKIQAKKCGVVISSGLNCIGYLGFMGNCEFTIF